MSHTVAAVIESSAGADVGKRYVDAAVFPGGDHIRVTNTPKGQRELAHWLKERGITRIGVEASGGYERPLRDTLHEEGVMVHVLNPRCVRAFAKAKARWAKSDALDARLIAEFTAKMVEAVPVQIDRLREELASLVRFRRTLVDKRADLDKAVRHLPAEVARRFQAMLAEMERDLAALDKEIAARIRAHDALATVVKLLMSAPGVGQVTAVTLAILLPELGKISGAKIAALVGVAPYDDDSGERHGRRQIAGGREDVRKALYMGVVAAATRGKGVLRDFYERLIAKGKQNKVALVACMRKLIVRLNAMLAAGRPWEEQSA